MEAKTADEIMGFEYDWLAVDADGHIGLFSTAGGGFAPPEFLQDIDAHDAGVEALMASPASTVCRFFPEVAIGLPNAWKDAAERGLFAFDSDPNGGPYRLVASPENPATLIEVPEETRSAASLVKLHSVRFGAWADTEGAVLPWP